MNDDPEMSKFLTYDGLVFPKPYETVKLPPEFIDKLWVSGFMDRANRDGPKKVSYPMMLKSLYACLFSSLEVGG